MFFFSLSTYLKSYKKYFNKLNCQFVRKLSFNVPFFKWIHEIELESPSHFFNHRSSITWSGTFTSSPWTIWIVNSCIHASVPCYIDHFCWNKKTHVHFKHLKNSHYLHLHINPFWGWPKYNYMNACLFKWRLFLLCKIWSPFSSTPLSSSALSSSDFLIRDRRQCVIVAKTPLEMDTAVYRQCVSVTLVFPRLLHLPSASVLARPLLLWVWTRDTPVEGMNY